MFQNVYTFVRLQKRKNKKTKKQTSNTSSELLDVYEFVYEFVKVLHSTEITNGNICVLYQSLQCKTKPGEMVKDL